MDETTASPSTVIVPLDGSDLAARALPIAVRLSRATRARIMLLTVLPPIPFDVDIGEGPTPEEVLTNLAERLAAEYPDVTITPNTQYLQDGGAAAALCAIARDQPDSIVVMSTHGRSGLGRWLYGSVADQILRSCTRPICLVGPACEETQAEDRPLRLLVTLDGSAFAEQVLPIAAWIATASTAKLHLIQVVPHTPALLEEELNVSKAYLRTHAERLAEQGISATVHAEIGYPSATIHRVARTQGVDLITLATHGRGGLARTVLGSMATTLLAGSAVPLLLVRPAGLHEGTPAPEIGLP